MARGEPRHGPNARRTVFEALTGRRGADVSGSRTGDLAAQMRAAYGVSRRDPGRPDTAAAATALGVSQRQVQRYLRGENKPKPDTEKRLRAAARQAASTQRGRRAAVASAQRAAAQNQKGLKVAITGRQGPDADYERFRTITMRLSPELADDYYNAYIAGGEDAALKFLTDNSSPAYQIDSWHIGDLNDMQVGERDDL